MTNLPEIKIQRMHFLSGDTSTKAFCNILISETFLVKGLRVIQGAEGLFVSMPSQKGKDGNWYDIFFPVTKETYKSMQDIILEAYSKGETIGENYGSDE